MEKVTVVTRSFQSGAGGTGKKYDAELFGNKVARPIAKLLKFGEVVEKIIVVTNGEPGHRLAENNIENGKTPTIMALEQTFPGEVASGRLMPHICRKWGRNPGSGAALNEGANLARISNAKWIMNWSPEIDMDGYLITKALSLAEQRNLFLIGFLRERWWERPQWNVAQNTAIIWDAKLLEEIGGFAPECDGTGETINLPIGEVLVAGMEDFHATIRAMKARPSLRWGMVGRENPLKWDVNFPHGSEREKNHLVKVARQYEVMKIWASRIFPELSFETVMGKLFASYHLD